jgi:hypothetical protein
MANNDTAALVVALSAQLTKFEKDMQRAGVMADKTVADIEDKFSKANPSFAGSFLGNFLGNLSTKALESAIAFAIDLKDRFIELEKTAHLVGVSMNDIFGIQQAASKSGASVAEVTQSVKGLAVLLDQMQRGDKNSLSALLDANPAALQGVNRDALTLQQTFGIVADLVENARTEIQKIDIAKAAGQTETMVKFLEKGADETDRLAKNAAAAAPDLQKLADGAKAFDDAWKTAVQNIKAYFSENLFGGFKQDLIDITAILEGLQKFLGLFKHGLLDTQAAAASEEINKLKVSIENLNRTPNPSGVISRQELGPTGGGTSTRDRDRPLSNVPSQGGSERDTDAFDRAIDQANKRIAILSAETATIGQNSEAMERARVVAGLEEAAKRANTEAGKENTAVTAEQRIRIDETANAMLNAARASREQQTAFQGLNESLRFGGNQLVNVLDQATQKGFSFRDAMATVMRDVSRQMLQAAITGEGAFAKLFGSNSSNGGVGGILGLFAGSSRSSELPGFGTSNFIGPLPGNAGGTDNWRGGPTRINEEGGEILDLPKGTRIIPHDVSKGMMGGVNAPVSIAIDARGADPAVEARFNAQIAGLKASLPGVIVSTVKSAQRGRSL